MKRLLSIFGLLVLAACPATGAVLRTVAELDDFICGTPEVGADFELRVSFVEDANPALNSLVVQDQTGAIGILFASNLHPAKGEHGLIRGKVFVEGGKIIRVLATELKVLGHAPPPQAQDLKLDQIGERTPAMTLIRTEGEVVDVFPDEIDPVVNFILLKDGNSFLPVSFSDTTPHEIRKLKDARVRVTGFLYRATYGGRKFAGPYLSALSSSVTTLVPPPADPFAFPPLEDTKYLSPETVLRFGKRTVTGVVTATWGGNRLMVRTDDSRTVNIELQPGMELPACKSRITAVGYPATDLFRINLTRAQFRRETDGASSAETKPEDIRLESVLTDDKGRPLIDYRRHGRLIRLIGRVGKLPIGDSGSILLECGALTANIDISSNPHAADGLAVGNEIEVTGYCRVESENWRPDNIFPRLKGISVVIRTPADIRLLKGSPWWTRGRLMALVGALLTVLLGILAWNAALRRVATRRSRQLLKEQISRISSELRVGERTRLAVELHDAISQTLTGVTLQINAADRVADADLPKAHRHLDVAAKSLRSCRQELRNCLWDLRNDTLGETDLATAVRQTLTPHLDNAELRIRFSVPRNRLTDNTTHALLRILRELAVNAVRHGKASVVRVAGSIEDGKLMFSVADDGCGFDPTRVPGMAEGHYGLQGIRERVAAFEGEMNVRSVIGKGSKVTVSIRLPGTAES